MDTFTGCSRQTVKPIYNMSCTCLAYALSLLSSLSPCCLHVKHLCSHLLQLPASSPPAAAGQGARADIQNADDDNNNIGHELSVLMPCEVWWVLTFEMQMMTVTTLAMNCQS